MLENMKTDNHKSSLVDSAISVKKHFGSKKSDTGTVFRYFDPSADRVYVVGSFNGWSESHPMQRSHNGIWTAVLDRNICFDGSTYKYKVYCNGQEIYVTDPYCDVTDGEPYHNSLICESNGYAWNDSSYLDLKHSMYDNGFDRVPLHVYEISLGAWCADREIEKSYQNVAKELSVYARQMGYTHVLVDDALVRDRGGHTAEYYVPDRTFGDPYAFRCFVDTMHKARIGVIINWNFDNGQDIYSKYGLASELILHLMQSYHLDGIALDANDRNGACIAYDIAHDIRKVERDSVVIVRGSATTVSLIGDHLVWNECCGRDVLNALTCSFTKRKAINIDIANGTESIVSFGQYRYIASLPGDEWRAFAGARAAFCSLMTTVGKKHTYMGCEIGMTDDSAVDWTVLEGEYNAGLQLCCSDIGEIYLAHPSLWQSSTIGVLDDSYSNDGVVLYERVLGDEKLLILVNVSVDAYEGRELFVGEDGAYDEIFNSDSKRYCGSGVTNKKTLRTVSVNGRRMLASVRIPPLAVAVFKKRSK